MDLDKIVHEPNRLRIMMILSSLDVADFNFLLTTLSLTRGNLSRHVEKLESAGYLKVKIFQGQNTEYKLSSYTKRGKSFSSILAKH